MKDDTLTALAELHVAQTAMLLAAQQSQAAYEAAHRAIMKEKEAESRWSETQDNHRIALDIFLNALATETDIVSRTDTGFPIHAIDKRRISGVTVELKSEFNPGDKVWLKSGGPEMTVVEIADRNSGIPKYLCKWETIFGRNSDVFTPERLTKEPCTPDEEKPTDQPKRGREFI